ncbi:MAG TPA: VOC family protein [Kofleriaceae bacterium]|jgi:catechol 2,3-dioxygenase-like lactoylglutathione lyase family enzyme|nr:VOC family protein [Kofleriaceae bacterium]
MIDHIELTTENFDAMCAFYARALVPLGYARVAEGPPAGFGTAYAPPFWLRPGITPRPNVHYAFRCATRALVRELYATALAAGGIDHRAPTLMPHVHASYFAAMVRDPDGNPIEFACHDPE